MVRQLFEFASKRAVDDPMLMQQMAIFEMTSPAGIVERASELLHDAARLAPWSKQIAHSLVELSIKKSDKAQTGLEKTKHLNEAYSAVSKLVKEDQETSHAYHTLIKIETTKLKEILSTADQAAIERSVKSIEAKIQLAKQKFPDDSFILDAESQFSALIQDEPRAFDAIRKAFTVNKRSPYVAIRLSTIYSKMNQTKEAEGTLREALELNPSEKDLNYRLATLLLDKPKPDLTEIRHYLRRAFTVNDNRFLSQFAFARVSFLLNDIPEATRVFDSLKTARVDIETKRKPQGLVYSDNGKLEVFKGTISKVEHSFSFLNMDGTQASAFIYRFYDHGFDWDTLHTGDRVIFNLGFNFRGPIAVNVAILD
jgi:tetratricopeptide (TPR) repeat protein